MSRSVSKSESMPSEFSTVNLLQPNEQAIRIPIQRPDSPSGSKRMQPRVTRFFPEDYLGPASRKDESRSSKRQGSRFTHSLHPDDSTFHQKRSTKFTRSTHWSRFQSLIHEDPGSWKRGTWGFFQFGDGNDTSRQSIATTMGGAMRMNMARMSRFEKLDEEEDADKTSYLSGFKLTITLVLLSLSLFVVTMDETVMATAIPSIASEFNSTSDIGWYASAYSMAACSVHLAFGKIYQMFPVKWTYAATILLYAAGSAITATAPKSAVVILGRAITGLGFPGITAGSYILLSQVAAPQRRPIYTGILGAVAGIGTIAGPLLGGAMTTYASWRVCFYIKVACVAFAIPLLAFLLPNQETGESSTTLKQKLRQFDWGGTGLFIGLMISLLLALNWGGDGYAWSDLRVIVMIVISVLHVAGLVSLQCWRPEMSFIPISVIKQRSIAIGFAFSMCVAGAMGVITYYVPLWFQRVSLDSAFESSLLLLPAILGLTLCSVVAAIIVAFIGYYTLVMILGSALMTIALGLATAFLKDATPSTWICYLVFIGCAAGLAFQQPLLAAQVVLPKEDIAMGISLLIFAQSLGSAIFVSVAKSLFANLVAGKTASVNGLGRGLDNPELWTYLAKNPEMLGDSIIKTFYLPVVLAGLGYFLVLGMEWKSTNTRRPGDEQVEETKGAV